MNAKRFLRIITQLNVADVINVAWFSVPCWNARVWNREKLFCFHYWNFTTKSSICVFWKQKLTSHVIVEEYLLTPYPQMLFWFSVFTDINDLKKPVLETYNQFIHWNCWCFPKVNSTTCWKYDSIKRELRTHPKFKSTHTLGSLRKLETRKKTVYLAQPLTDKTKFHSSVSTVTYKKLC